MLENGIIMNMQFAANTDNIIMICTKKTLQASRGLFSDLKKENDFQVLSEEKYSSGVLCRENNEITLKLSQKSPQKLFRQIKAGNIYIK
jgi:hypothetical protein